MEATNIRISKQTHKKLTDLAIKEDNYNEYKMMKISLNLGEVNFLI